MRSVPRAAEGLYRRFHKFDPRRQTFSNLKIPESLYRVGEAEQVLYRSDKLNPETLEDEGVLDYFHNHSAGVKMCLRDADAEDFDEIAVPARARTTSSLVVLGKCLGFTFRDPNGRVRKVEGTDPLPELCAVPPSGNILLVVQSKRSVLAMMWGGKLKVRPEGIVG